MAFSYISREGYQKIKDEFDHLTKVKRKELADNLARARDHGDLRENAEYDAAKEALARNESRIAELGQKIATLTIMDNLDLPDDKVYIGATVMLLDLNDHEEIEYKLVSEAEADIFENKLSVESLIGKGLLGHEVGEEVSITVPRGILKYKILAISRS